MRLLFGSLLCGLRSFVEVPLPSYSVRVWHPHDLDLHFLAGDEVVAEVLTSSGGFRVGSHLLFDDGGGNGVSLPGVNLHESVYGKLVSIHP